MTALLLDSIVLSLVLAKGALTDLTMKTQFLIQENKLNHETHSHLLPESYSVSMSSIVWYETLLVQFCFHS